MGINRPHGTLTVTPSTASGAAPLNTTYNYAATNDSPVNTADLPPPRIVSPTNDFAVVTDDTCSPLVFTGSDTIKLIPPLLEVGETWTFTCSRLLPQGRSPTRRASSDPTSATGRPWPDTSAQSTVTATGPDLVVAKSHAGPFVAGDRGRTYELTVRNAGNAATSGPVSLADQLPNALTATALAGPGWSCEPAALTCTRADPLDAGSSYPAVTLSADVASDAPVEVVNGATVSGGGEVAGATGNNSASDPTTIGRAKAPKHEFGFGRSSVNGDGGVTLAIEVPGAGELSADDASKKDLVKGANTRAGGPGKVKLGSGPRARRSASSQPASD